MLNPLSKPRGYRRASSSYRRGSPAVSSSSKSLRVLMRTAYVLMVFLFFAYAVKMPSIRDLSDSSFDTSLPVGVRLAEALLAAFAIGLVTLVYGVLIQRGSLMATTSLYPRKPIETNIGSLLDLTWPESSLRLEFEPASPKIRVEQYARQITDWPWQAIRNAQPAQTPDQVRPSHLLRTPKTPSRLPT